MSKLIMYVKKKQNSIMVHTDLGETRYTEGILGGIIKRELKKLYFKQEELDNFSSLGSLEELLNKGFDFHVSEGEVYYTIDITMFKNYARRVAEFHCCKDNGIHYVFDEADEFANILMEHFEETKNNNL